MSQIIIPLLVASIALNVYFFIKSRKELRLKNEQNRKIKQAGELANSKMDEIIEMLVITPSYSNEQLNNAS